MNPTYCKNSIIMLDSVTGTQMNSFIITTEDGKVLVMDGGFAQDADNLIGWLKRVTGEEIPHVDGWFLSHPHLDHITCLNHIMETRMRCTTIAPRSSTSMRESRASTAPMSLCGCCRASRQSR